MSQKKEAPFNNPFAGLKIAKSKNEEPAKVATKVNPFAPKVPAPVPVAAKSKKRTSEEEDAALFLSSIGDVEPVRQKLERERVAPPVAAAGQARAAEDAESLARLAELVSGEGEFSLSDSSEFIEGAVTGFDPRVMRKLRAGEFSAQATLDLHGLTREAAKEALEGFIQKSRIAGHRCVRVITGRGLHSQDSIPVLKQSVQALLTRGRVARQVLAFCSASVRDGGAGAVYVLLRR